MQTDIYISEIFGPTIQGEGKRIGKVSLFIRVAKCNMSCAGFNVGYKVNDIQKTGCDSFYSVDKAFKRNWEKLSSIDIVQRLKKLSSLKNIDIVITGGEALLYWKNCQFQNLLKYLIKNKHFVTIETNGSIKININKKYQKKIMFSIGLKLKNSGEKLEKRINKNTIDNLLNNGNHSYIKFVLSKNKEDIKELLDIQKRLNIKNTDIYLMPLGTIKKELETNAKYVVEQAIKYNFSYSDRLHIRIWDNKRKV